MFTNAATIRVKWLPASGEAAGDFPIFFHYVNVGPNVKEAEMITDGYANQRMKKQDGSRDMSSDFRDGVPAARRENGASALKRALAADEEAEYACAEAVWMYFVQREACGLPGHDAVIEAYGIPASVLAKVGARRPSSNDEDLRSCYEVSVECHRQLHHGRCLRIHCRLHCQGQPNEQ